MAMGLLESAKSEQCCPNNTSPSHLDSGLCGADPFADHDKESGFQLRMLLPSRLLAP